MYTKLFASQNPGRNLRRHSGYSVVESLIVLALLGVLTVIILSLVRRSLRPDREPDPGSTAPAVTAPAVTAPAVTAPAVTAPTAESADSQDKKTTPP